jgi:glycosyltransferase involved in cell wall biosynthesis
VQETSGSGRPTVLHVTTTDISLALLLGPQLRAFRDAGFEVLTASAPGPFVAGLEADGIRHFPLQHATRALALHHDALALAELTRLFRRLRPDVAHTHNVKPGIYGRIAARAARVPVIVNTQHGLYATSTSGFGRRMAVYSLERLAATCSDLELVQNPEDVETLSRLRVPRDKLVLLGNGIDMERFNPGRVTAERAAAVRRELGVGDGEVLFGAVGRLVWEKGYRELFEAARLLRTRVPNARIAVIGPHDPDKSDALGEDDLAQARSDGVLFGGMRLDVEDVYAALDVYVLASHREGFPRSAMEAAAMGRPLIATDIRGCRQVVDHERTGLLVPPREAPALADAIAALAGDPERRRAFGAAGLEKAAREFDDRRVIDITLEAYRRLLARPARRGKRRTAPVT